MKYKSPTSFLYFNDEAPPPKKIGKQTYKTDAIKQTTTQKATQLKIP